MLQLLGDELIGSMRLAVFELVKNAYDADANKVTVCLDLTSDKEHTITVTDDGEGMTLGILRSVWLVPGDDHRKKQRRLDRRTSKHKRLPLGEKGLGRFALHKLGGYVTLVTRAQGEDENVVEIDWNELLKKPYLDEAPVVITRRHPEVFIGRKTGTRIEIHQLREDWSRGEVRKLHNQITSICSPFESPGKFQAILQVPGHEEWIAELRDVSAILDEAIWKFSFELHNGKFSWKYKFNPIPGFKLDSREVRESNKALLLPKDDQGAKEIVADQRFFKGIGPIRGEFYVYDRDREIRERLPQIQALEKYLDEMGGVRVYRDGIRVYNYGERGDDWLGLDLRRVNRPTRSISRNIILGALHLSLKESEDLIEKTSRDGFVDNDACKRLRQGTLGVLGALEVERKFDKERIRQLTKSPNDAAVTKIDRSIGQLRNALKQKGLADKFEKYVTRIERGYYSMQETLLSSSMSGLNLALVLHEVERGIRALRQVIAKGANMDHVTHQVEDLSHLLGNFSTVLRRDNKREHDLKKLVQSAHQFNVLRFQHHKIYFDCPLLQRDKEACRAKFPFNLAIGALSNLIDNALYWLRVRWPKVSEDNELSEVPPVRKLHVGISNDFEAGPAIIVADNGTGFHGDSAENLVRPFFTRKPDGMGLGLYYANLAMDLSDGKLIFPAPGEAEIPIDYDGAIIGMIFKGMS